MAVGGEHSVEQGHLDPLAQAVALPGVQGHGDTDYPLERGVYRGDGNGGVHRPLEVSGRGAGTVGRGGSADNALEGPDVGPGVIGSKSGKRAIDQAGVGLSHCLGAQTQTVHHPRPEVLHNNVRALDQRLGRRQVLRLLQVQNGAALAPVPGGVGGRLPPGPTRRVDPYHAGALIGQQHPGQRTGNILSKVDNADTVERARHD